MGLVEMSCDRPAVLHDLGAVMDDRNGLRLGKGDLLLLSEAHGLVAPGKALVFQGELGAPTERARTAIVLKDEIVERDHTFLICHPACGRCLKNPWRRCRC